MLKPSPGLNAMLGFSDSVNINISNFTFSVKQYKAYFFFEICVLSISENVYFCHHIPNNNKKPLMFNIQVACKRGVTFWLTGDQ